MTLRADELLAAAVAATGYDDFGPESGPEWREGLERLTQALADEADLSELGETILRLRLSMLAENRLRIEAAYRAHPELDDEVVAAPLFIVGLPRTGTTALSNLLAADPQIRSLRLWESTEPTPPPEAAAEHDDPRIARAAQGLEAMYATFPRMRSLYFQTATGPSECQDLLGYSWRTAHFDGMARVPSYTAWVLGCDMGPAYRYHRRTLRLLQWHCGPRRWHLKTPVHMLALDDLDRVYPDARFVWTHRDPAAVLGSVCDLVTYTRSWVSERDDAAELGSEQVELWAEALRRAMAFRDRVGEGRFADVSFDRLQTDPVGAVADAYGALGVPFDDDSRRAVTGWAAAHPPGSHGSHESDVADFSLDAGEVRRRFAFYLERFDVPSAG